MSDLGADIQQNRSLSFFSIIVHAMLLLFLQNVETF